MVGGISYLALAATLTGAPATLSVAARAPTLAVVITPFGRASALGTTALLEALAAALEPRAGLDLRSGEQAGVDVADLLACPSARRLTCWVRTVQRGTDARVRHLLVVSARPLDPARDRVALTWMDLQAAQRTLDSARGLSPEALEDRLFTQAVHTPPKVVGTEALQRVMADLVREYMQEGLREVGQWGARGQVRVRHACDACAVRFDGSEIGLALPEMILVEVPVGPHTVALVEAGSVSGASLAGCEAPVTVEADSRSELDLRACTALGAPGGGARSAVRFSGVALTVVGAALGAVAIHRATQAPDTVCVGGTSCAGIGLASLRFDANAGPTGDPTAFEPGGPSVAALAAGLGMAGGGLVAGSYLTDDEQWWWSPIAAAVIGGVAFAAVSAAD